MMVYEAVTRAEKRIFVDAFFEGFGLYCKKLGLTMRGSHSSDSSESIYVILSKEGKRWKVRISGHYTRGGKNAIPKNCHFNFVTGDDLYEQLLKFTEYFIPPKKIRKKKTVP